MSDRSVTNKLIVVITKTTIFLAVIALFSMMLLITLDVTLNKVIGRPIPGTIEVTSYYFMLFVVFLTLPNIEKNDAHISADFIVARFSSKVQNIFKISGKLLTITFYSFLTYGALTQAIKSTYSLETAMSNFTFYIWPARWGVVLGLVFAITVIVIIVIQRFKNNQ
jgi:TRAP-type C4-dicarboxylate transport system permease small subunit